MQNKRVTIKPLSFWHHWITTRDTYKAMEKVDGSFAKKFGGKRLRFLAQNLLWPLYWQFKNDGYGLWVNGKLEGFIYLQYKKSGVTHIENIVVNNEHRQSSYAIMLLTHAHHKVSEHGHRYATAIIAASNARWASIWERRLKAGTDRHKVYELAEPLANVQVSPEASSKIVLRTVKGKEAYDNMMRFYLLEQQKSNEKTAYNWQEILKPRLPKGKNSKIFAVYFEGSNEPDGHANFFDWGGYKGWYIYLNPKYWGSLQEQTFIKMLISQTPQFYRLQLRFGSLRHFQKVEPFALDLGFSAIDEWITVVYTMDNALTFNVNQSPEYRRQLHAGVANNSG